MTKKLNFYTFIFVFALCVPLFAQNNFQATVNNDEAIFTFPLDPDREYEWSSGGLTYQWSVIVTNNRKRYEFGFSLYTAMGASIPESGDINAVLNAGQFSAWSGGKVVDAIKIDGSASENKDKLIIKITDKASIRALFSSKPPFVTFSVVPDLFEKAKNTRVQVRYSAGEKRSPSAGSTVKPTVETETRTIVAEGENAPEAMVRVVSATKIEPGKYKVTFAAGPCFSQSAGRVVFIVDAGEETLEKDNLFFQVPSPSSDGFALRRADSRETGQYMKCKWR